MNKTTSNYINLLLDESELFKSTSSDKSLKESFDFSEETLLVTGAAGSIGSGIVKQLRHGGFKKLILVDNAESPFYYLMNGLELGKVPDIECLLADVRDESSMQWLFETFRPTIIFHTAAYKHVPMMEEQPYQAVKLNIIATCLLADLAIKHKAKKFIFISTDKAVNPIGVMGMTKYIAECYLKHLNTQNKTSFLITRFGNILGSNGSVAPLFIKQIEAGIPLTVTNKDISRYFITKNKACHLILKIAAFEALNKGLFTFDMGQPIKIIDLAEAIIARFKSISNKIKITNLRPGEKLHEEIISENESLETTGHKAVFLVVNKANIDLKPINLEVLKKINPYQNPAEIKSILKAFI